MMVARIFCVFSFVLFAQVAFSQSWVGHYQAAQKSYDNNDLDGAFQSANTALATYLQESGEVSDNYASILRLLENISYSQGKVQEALTYVEKELLIREKKKDVAYATALTQQGIFFQAIENYSSADRSFGGALEVLSAIHQPTETPVLEAQLMLAANAYLNNDNERAMALFEKAVPEISGAPGSAEAAQAFFYYGSLCLEKKIPAQALTGFLKVKRFYEQNGYQETGEYASVMMNLGRAAHDLHDNEQAETYYKVADELFKKLGIQGGDYLALVNERAINLQGMGAGQQADEVLSSMSSTEASGTSAAVLLSNKATLSKSKGDYKAAEKFYQEALDKLDRQNRDHVILYAELLQNRAVLLTSIGRVSEAEKLLADAEAMIIATFGKDDPHLVHIGLSHANALSQAGRSVEALQRYREIISRLGAAKSNSTEWARAANGMALIAFNEGNLARADSLFDAIALKYQTGSIWYDATYPAVLNNQAAVKQLKGQFLYARNLLRRAANYIRKTSGVNNIDYAIALDNLGYIDLDMGSLSLARVEIDSSLHLIEQLLGDNSLPYALALVNQGKYFQNSGEYNQAEPFFKKAFRIISGLPDATTVDWVKAANALAIFYQTMGNYDDAEPLYKSILSKVEKTMSKQAGEYSTALQNMAALLQLQEKYQQAEPILEEALAIDRKVYGESHPQYIIGLKNLAALYQKTGKLENARVLIEQARNGTREVYGEDHPAYASAVGNLAALYQDLGNMQEAEKAWITTVTLRKKLLGDQHPDYSRALFGLATVYFGQGKFEEANQQYKLVTEQYLRQIREYFPTLSEKEKGAFYQKIKPVFDTYEDFCVQYHKRNPSDFSSLRDLYHVQLSTKAILLNSSNKVRQTILASGDTALVGTFRRWLGVKEQIVRYYALSNEERTHFQNVDALKQRANDLEKHLSTASAEFRTQFTEREFKTQDVASALLPGEAAVEIIRIPRKFVRDSIYYIALVLKHNNPDPSLVVWPEGRRLETRLYKFHRNAIKFHLRDTFSYNHYWKPLNGKLADVKKLYVSADGVFNKVNLNMLQNNADHHWILERYAIHLVSNTKEIVEGTSRKASANRKINLYGYADYQLEMSPDHVATAAPHTVNRNFGFDGDIPLLPGTEKEVDQIHSLFTARQFDVRSFKRSEANELNIKKTEPVKVLHIATHGFFMNDVEIDDSESEDHQDFFSNPLLRSGILLSGAGIRKTDKEIISDEDGILTAYEAMNIDLSNTDLVVLSACETALGEVRNGEGVYGLQRSFIVAGAGAVLMSLWQVDDAATQELMVNFYQHWLAGETKHEAFRKAQLLMKEKYQSPYYWGAFILVGLN